MTKRTGSMIALAACLPLVVAAVHVASPPPYPLDGDTRTGIRRLTAYRLMQEGKIAGSLRLPPGARLPTDAIRLRLKGVNDTYDIGPDTPKDSALQAALERIVGRRHPSYRVAMLDITDPWRPRYAEVLGNEGYIPGSVGKLLVMTGLFNELKERYPTNLEARAALLRDTWITADKWVIPNSHAVPVVNDDMTAVSHRAIRIGDDFSLWEWVDHMVSPSSNAAGSMVWKHAILIDVFGPEYPVATERAEAYFAETPKATLADRAVAVVEDPMLAAGLDTVGLRHRTMFTNTAQRIVPGRGSHATPRQLVRWMLKLEQGKLVDEWSSLEMKRLIYFTRRRYRYASSPALADAAVYFKSGSLYRCVPEPGYQCGQYRGNAENLMHSVAIVESPATGDRQRVYMLSMMSNVPKINSAAEHQEMATRIERFMRTLYPDAP
jgi:hypothetical protein